MAKLFVSFEVTYPGKPSMMENMVLDCDEPKDERDVSFLQLSIHNKLPEERRPIAQPTIVWFKELKD